MSHAILLADGHKGYGVPIGGVVAHPTRLSVSSCGFDIACGVMCIETDALYKDIAPNLNKIMDDVVSHISFGIGRINNTEIDHPLFQDAIWQEKFYADLLPKARAQLGTVGSGNHYVDILHEESTGKISVACHFGSRGLGHTIATRFIALAGGKDGMDAPPVTIDTMAQFELAVAYLSGVRIAGEYAYAGREYVCRSVVNDILKAKVVSEVHNHHNFLWREEHFGEKYWVGRKGSTPAFPGQRGFIGGSMGDNAVIVEGVDGELSKKALYSTVHGAGRVMSRTQAKGKVHRKTGVKLSEGAISPEQMFTWVNNRGLVLRGADLDEAPQAYRRLPEVLAAQGETIRVIHNLKPIGVAMAPSSVIDPYKD